MPELSQQQFIKLNQMYKEMDDTYHSISAKMGFSDSAFMILYSLCYDGCPLTQKELCELWSLKKQTIHSGLHSLIESGYVRIESSPKRPRTKLVFLTAEGEAITKKTVIPLYQAEQSAFEHLTNEERAMLISLNQKHLKHFKEETTKLLNWYDNQ